MSEVDAVIGNWYQLSNGQMFDVVALDEREGSIEIQHFEGEVEELDSDSWREMSLTVIEPPEDWTGAYEEMEKDDLGYSDAVFIPESWSGPFGVIEKEG